jgi:hypothetical protein
MRSPLVRYLQQDQVGNVTGIEMQVIKDSWLKPVLVLMAFLLALVQAGVSVMLYLFGGFPQNSSQAVFLVSTGFLWIPALTCGKSPLGGLLVFTSLLIVAIVLFLGPVHIIIDGSTPFGKVCLFFRFALIGGVFLVFNLVLAKMKRRRMC